MLLLKDHSGRCLEKLDSDLQSESSLKPFNIAYSMELKMSFQNDIQCCFVSEIMKNITARLPDKDTGIIACYGAFNRSQLPPTSENTMEIQHGEAEIHRLREHYGVGDSPLINSYDLMTEWVDLRVYVILNCRTKSVREVIKLLAKSIS